MNKYALIAFMFSSNLYALENQLNICTRSDELRAIEIFYLTGERVPCEVSYTKNSTSQILWRAQTFQGFCESRAAELMEKLRSSGWRCKSVAGEPWDES